MFWGKKNEIFLQENCFPIEIKVKYSVAAAAVASRAVMTDFIHLFMVLEVLIAMQEQNEKESNKDAAPEERKLQHERESNQPSVLLPVTGKSFYCLREKDLSQPCFQK